MLNRILVVWYDQKKNRYFYRFISITNVNHKVGFINSYGHKIVLIIPVTFKIQKESFKKRLIKRLIAFLEYIE